MNAVKTWGVTPTWVKMLDFKRATFDTARVNLARFVILWNLAPLRPWPLRGPQELSPHILLLNLGSSSLAREVKSTKRKSKLLLSPWLRWAPRS